MGSPYISMEIAKVNVIRTPVGAAKLLMQLCHITGHPLDTSTLPSMLEAAIGSYKEAATSEQFETAVLLSFDQYNGHTFDWTIVDYLKTYAKAYTARARIVQVIATRYEFEETRLLDRCVVFDFSGFPREMRGLSVGKAASAAAIPEKGCPSAWSDYLTLDAARALGFVIDDSVIAHVAKQLTKGS